jgi:hypothetical protein
MIPATESRGILQENTGNRWNMEAVFRPEIVRIFSDGFLSTSCAFWQELAGNRGPGCSTWDQYKDIHLLILLMLYLINLDVYEYEGHCQLLSSFVDQLMLVLKRQYR